MSSTSSRPADQPNQRRTARNVSRASSSPGEHLEVDAGLVADRGQHLGPFGASRSADVAKASRSSVPWSSATSSACRTDSTSRVAPGVVDAAVVGEVLGQAQLGLVGVGRQRPRALVRVDDQQVHGVRADVEHREPHAYLRRTSWTTGRRARTDRVDHRVAPSRLACTVRP